MFNNQSFYFDFYVDFTVTIECHCITIQAIGSIFMIKFTMNFKQFTVTKANTILVYLPDHFYVGMFVHLYIYIVNVCLRTICGISMFY